MFLPGRFSSLAGHLCQNLQFKNIFFPQTEASRIALCSSYTSIAPNDGKLVLTSNCILIDAYERASSTCIQLDDVHHELYLN